jgi:tape measure domain-containing protein
MAGGLTIKIGADTQGAKAQFEELSASQNRFIKSLEDADKVLAKSNLDAFSDKQKVAQMALTATRGEFEAVSASVKAYQSKIEALLKQGLTPENEGVKKLNDEMEALKARKEAMTAASEAEAQKEAELARAIEEAAKAAEREAEIAVKCLDAKSDLEKENVRLAAEQDRVRESVKKLLSSGMKPESDEVKKLEAEYKKLTAEIETNNKARKAQEGMAKGAAAALAAIAAATAAAIGYATAQAAKVEDMTAAYTTLLGSQEKAAELVKRINKEAATTPFEIDSISSSMNKLLPLFKGNSDAAVKTFRMIGDTAGGNAQKLDTLTDAYAKVQMKGKTSMEELNRISDAGVPIFDTLSEMLGVTTARLFDMSKDGDITAEHLTQAFQKMTSEGGVFFNGMENSSDTFNMRLLGIKENVSIVAAQIGEKFLPALKDVAGSAGDAVAAFSEWISEGDNLENLLDGVGYALAGVTTGLVGFLAVMKGAAAVEAMKTAVEGLNKALKENMLGLIATGVAAIAVPAFMALAKHIEKSQNKVRELNKELATNKQRYEEASGVLEGLNPEKVLDYETTEKLIRLYPELTGKIEAYKNTVGDTVTLLGDMTRAKKVETIDAMVAAYQKETKAISEYRKGVEATEYVVANSMGVQKEAAQRTLDSQKATLDAMTKHAEDSERAIGTAYEGIGKRLIGMTTGGFAVTRDIVLEPKISTSGSGGGAAGGFAKEVEKTLSQQLQNISLIPPQDYGEALNAFKSHLNQRADLERVTGDDRVAALVAQEARILANMKLTEEQKRALREATAAAQAEAMKKEEEEATKTAEMEAAKDKEGYDKFVSQQAEKLETAKRYLALERDEETDSYEQKLEYLNSQYEAEKTALAEQQTALREMKTIDDATRLAEEEQINLAMLESYKKYEAEKGKLQEAAAAAEQARNQQRLSAAAALAGSMSQLVKAAGKESVAAVVAAKAFDMIQAALNTKMAISNALATVAPWPVPQAFAVAAGIAGLAQQVAIASTPIPSAETGGRFVVPQTFTGVDSGLMRVNQGEEAEIIPRGGGSYGEGGRTVIYLDGQPLVDFANKKLRSGEIYEISPSWNL